MAFSVLNNVSSMAAQNQLNLTSMNLQKTLFHLSSGSRINSGADDAAGLAIADGLHANITALNQSSRNANDGVGKLQVADGALAQVTNLLNRAVTLATESATSGTVTNAQRSNIDAEFTAIKAEIDRIGQKTTFNGQAIFQAAVGPDPNTFNSTTAGLTAATALTNTATVTIGDGVNPNFVFTAGATSKVSDLINAITAQSHTANGISADAYLNGAGNLVISDPLKKGTLTVATTDAALGSSLTQPNTPGASTLDVFLSDSSAAGASTISVGIGALGSANLNAGASTINISADTLATQGGASTALAKLNQAIQNVASLRGGIGAGINRLQTAVQVMSSQSQNLASAEDGIRSADISQEVANMTKFNILMQTGMSALSQANQSQQAVLKLLQ